MLTNLRQLTPSPARFTAGMMNLLPMSRSLRDCLSSSVISPEGLCPSYYPHYYPHSRVSTLTHLITWEGGHAFPHVVRRENTASAIPRQARSNGFSEYHSAVTSRVTFLEDCHSAVGSSSSSPVLQFQRPAPYAPGRMLVTR